MDRLSVVIRALIVLTAFASLAVAFFGGCERADEGGGEPAAASHQRVAAVAARVDERTLEDLCDVMPDRARAPTLAYPPLSSDSSSPPTSGWRWINLWATWCKPCIEEIPMLREWADDFTTGGTALEIVFISVDESAEAIDSYLQEHAGAPTEFRVADVEQVPAWLAGLGLDGGAPLPVHVVVDPDDRVRCLRAGKVYPRDVSLVERLLTGDD